MGVIAHDPDLDDDGLLTAVETRRQELERSLPVKRNDRVMAMTAIIDHMLNENVIVDLYT